MDASDRNRKGATHATVPNEKNKNILVSTRATELAFVLIVPKVGMRDGVSGKFNLVRRQDAMVSVFDSNFLIGDGIWVCSPSTAKIRRLY
jgi:branched-chain amino acid aminotransferase